MSLLPLGLLSQGGGAGVINGIEQIATVLGTGSSGTITFSSIPATYKHLQIRFTARLSGNSTVTRPIDMTYNGQGSSYYMHYMMSDGGSMLSDNQGTMTVAWSPVLTGTSGSFVSCIVDILDYADSTKFGVMRSFMGYQNGSSSGSYPQGISSIGLLSGLRTTATAITQLQFVSGSGNFESGTRFTLYGIRG